MINPFNEDELDGRTKEQLEIDKRIQANDKVVKRILADIVRKPLDNLTVEDMAFMRARQSYLSKAQREEYADILNQKEIASVEAEVASELDPLFELSRNQLNKKARDLGIVNSEEMKSKREVIEAIQAVQ